MRRSHKKKKKKEKGHCHHHHRKTCEGDNVLSCKMLSKGTGVKSLSIPNPKKSAKSFLSIHKDILKASYHAKIGLSRAPIRGTARGIRPLVSLGAGLGVWLAVEEDLQFLLEVGVIHLDGFQGLGDLLQADLFIRLWRSSEVKLVTILLNDLAAISDFVEAKSSR